ncbi:MAG: hypothetical protein KatS3mg124_2220 [Porticoccaceae bacterium]|nr:MAG: hypothetical protein KatS3mg124_2220 [Porticoccaceae bacterium]
MKAPRQWQWLAACLATLALAACGGAGEEADGASLAPAPAESDWPNFSGDGHARQYAPFDQISRATVARLGLAWYFDLEPGFSVSSPAKCGPRLFVTTGHSHVRALDPQSGRLLWEYDAGTRRLARNPLQMTWGNKGLACDGERVYIATTDGRVIALAAADGAVVWETRQFGLDEPRYANGAPRVFDGKVIVGHGGADLSPIRGYVTAYDAATGRQLWRFYTVPGDPSRPPESRAEALMRATWKGDWYGAGGGGTAWHAFSYDPELDLLYIGVGNGFPYNQALRSPGGGDNLFLASIVAVRADTGEYVWHFQVCPGEEWDCTAVQDMTLATLEIDGVARKVVMQAPKNGFFYVLDAATGEFLSAGQIADKVTWAQGIDAAGRPIEHPKLRYRLTGETFELWPGPQGAHSWLPQAYSPRTGLVYVPILEIGGLIGPLPPGYAGFGAGMGALVVADPDLPGSRRSHLTAWDPRTQRPAWRVDLPGDWPGGVLATAGDLVFQGRLDGRFLAYDAESGEPLWEYRAPTAIVAPPISYLAGGKQYVVVLTGSGSQGGGILATGNADLPTTDYWRPRRVLAFALDGAAREPAFAPPPRRPAVAEDFAADPAQMAAGGQLYAATGCLVCHGMNALAGGAAPDLRFSPVVLDPAAFAAVVRDGARKLRGMPAYPQLDDAALAALRHYLMARAAGLDLPPAPPVPSGT